MTRALAACCSLTLLVAACNTTSKSGAVGDRLSGGGVSVTLQRVDMHPRVPRHDLSGLSSPAPGDRLIGALVTVCSKLGAAIGPSDFAIGLSGGASGRVKFPALNYSRAFDVVRTGCRSGWLTFEVPASSSPDEIKFAFDYTGSSSPGEEQQESHQRFSWKLD